MSTAERASRHLSDVLDAAMSTAQPKREWLIWSIEHDGWWKIARRGYTKKIGEAGLYSFDEARRIVHNANHFRTNLPFESMVHVEDFPWPENEPQTEKDFEPDYDITRPNK